MEGGIFVEFDDAKLVEVERFIRRLGINELQGPVVQKSYNFFD